MSDSDIPREQRVYAILDTAAQQLGAIAGSFDLRVEYWSNGRLEVLRLEG